jgi:hypothetical protein
LNWCRLKPHIFFNEKPRPTGRGFFVKTDQVGLKLFTAKPAVNRMFIHRNPFDRRVNARA